MFTLESTVHIDGLRGSDVFDFLMDCSDEQYQQWWPGTHLHLHTVKHRPGHVGDLISMDERVGRRHLRLRGTVVEAVPGTTIVWQLMVGVRLPVWLRLDLKDDGGGVTIGHTIRAGFEGFGSLLDPIFRWYFSDHFARDLDRHARTEFRLLRDLLTGRDAHAQTAGVQT
jgi:hypothetical protein